MRRWLFCDRRFFLFFVLKERRCRVAVNRNKCVKIRLPTVVAFNSQPSSYPPVRSPPPTPNLSEISGTPPAEEDPRTTSKHPVSLKHAMSRVKGKNKPSSSRTLVTPPRSAAAATAPRGSGGTPATAATAATEADSTPPAEQYLTAAASSTVSAATATTAIRASIESAVSFADEEDAEDEDSPRYRGRQYDDRWKVPGHAESVLASFVERLEHRGHHGGHVDADGNPVVSSAADALLEARANRGVAMEVLVGGVGRSGGGGDRSARGAAAGQAAGAVAATSSAGGASSKKRRSVGGRSASKTGVKRKDGGGGAGKVGARREPSGKGKTGKSASPPPPRSDRVVATGGGGSWSRFGSMALQSFQRAAEAFVGVQKDVEDEEAQKDRQTELERTREAASAFLSSSRSLPDQE